ncbi:MAG: hypothetical protein ACOC39_00975 [Desulfovermiculus sp.]
MKTIRLSLLVYKQSAYGIKSKEDQVHEVILRQAGGSKVGMYKSQASQPAFALPVSAQIRDDDLVPVTDQEHCRPSLAVDQDTQLAAGHFTESGQFVSLLAAETALAWITAAENAVKKPEMAWLEATGVADNLSGYKELLVNEFVSSALAII